MRAGNAAMIMAMAALLAGVAWGAQAPARDGAVDAVVQATRAFYAALNRGDAKDADQYLLPGGDSFPRDGSKLSPEAATQDASLRDLAGKFAAGLHFKMTLEDLQVHVYDAHAAVATFYTVGSTAMKDHTLSEGTYRASYVWVNVHGSWKIAHFHLSPLKP